MLACELIDNNGKELLKCVNQYIEQWGLEDAFKKYDGPIPTIRELDAEFQKLVKEKNQIYSEFKIARTEMMELLSAKQNVEHFLGEQNRLEQDIQKKKGDTSL